jgi:hypothetical protein
MNKRRFKVPPDYHWGFVIKCAVRARVIVKMDPCVDPCTRLNAISLIIISFLVKETTRIAFTLLA